MAVHLGLAFAHLGLEKIDELFIAFWNTPNAVRHKEFVSFIGRGVISREQAGEEWFKENGVKLDKLVGLWEWLLENEAVEREVFSGFGFWINPKKEIIQDKELVLLVSKTLKRSEGEIDWDYGLNERLERFAEANPKETLEIIRNFLLKDAELNPYRRVPMFSLENEIKKAFTIIYKDDELKDAVRELIDLLIEKGSSMFWGLKDVLGGDE